METPIKERNHLVRVIECKTLKVISEKIMIFATHNIEEARTIALRTIKLPINTFLGIEAISTKKYAR